MCSFHPVIWSEAFYLFNAVFSTDSLPVCDLCLLSVGLVGPGQDSPVGGIPTGKLGRAVVFTNFVLGPWSYSESRRTLWWLGAPHEAVWGHEVR